MFQFSGEDKNDNLFKLFLLFGFNAVEWLEPQRIFDRSCAQEHAANLLW